MRFLKNRKIKLLLLLQLFVLSGLISFSVMTTSAHTSSVTLTNSSSSSTQTNAQITSSMQNADLVAIYDKNASISMPLSQYPESFYSNYTGMTVAMCYNGSSLFVYVSAPTQGWVGVGFNTYGYGMVGGYLMVGAVTNANNTGATVQSYYAVQYSQPSMTDINSVTQANGTQSGNTTTLQFVMNMLAPANETQPISYLTGSNPPLTQAKNLTAGNTYSLLMAYGRNDDDYMAYQHVRQGIATLYIAPQTVLPRTGANIKVNFNNLPSTTVTENTIFTGNITLTDTNGNGIANQTVHIYEQGLVADVNLANATTNAQGVAAFNFSFIQQYSAPVVLYAKYDGNILYKRAETNPANYWTFQYSGFVPTESNPYVLIPNSYDFLVPWLTGLGAIATIAGIWMCFGFVIYTVIFKNATEPNGKQRNKSD